jgi:DNA mismatch repair ATPase MutS
MGSKNIKAYCYYKEQYPNTVMLFRVGDNYEVYREDADKISKILGLDIENTTLTQEAVTKVIFPVEKGYDYVSELTSHNLITKMISQRNQDGEFDVPDVDGIRTDRETDY